MKILYFASVREKVGKAEEDVTLPERVATVADLMGWLSERNESYAAAFEHRKTIRAAVDKTHVNHETALDSAREIAFFPPMTGG
ncbi:molybdopterin converting factor subunit 1 [Methylocapsa palsarum]|uniref:Molybdopterin synthase sulfur carrier subunit n=1 Tax=Methylocapsa palsarum TaxID=1612308 RepID=A0A1I3XFM8_9HYPH|nr:molybdopterin converting factor subunit 1 [Methylocapsa palsarum]SFK17901.1 molybdopterin synthase sulfur carrier subunit [Methylocapsa palsarum]